MMNVSVCAKEFDLSGVLDIAAFDEGVEISNVRRINRIATLDGGSVFTDKGYTHSDRVLSVTYPTVSVTHDDTARRILESHSRVTVAIGEGVFEAAPESIDITAEENTFNFFIVDKVSED